MVNAELAVDCGKLMASADQTFDHGLHVVATRGLSRLLDVLKHDF